MRYSDSVITFISHGIEFRLNHHAGRLSPEGKTNYYMSHNNYSFDKFQGGLGLHIKCCDDVKLRSVKQMAKKYLRSDCVISIDKNSTYTMYNLEINTGTTREQRAAFLGAISVKADYISND
ncbi:MAG: hypothetical protein ACI92I_000521 [Acidimicrobiales bacterium]|jgi:hypothetical protein